MMSLWRCGVLSAANMWGLLSLIAGIIIGILAVLFAVIVYGGVGGTDYFGSDFGSLDLGVLLLGWLVIIPIIYGIFGFLFGLIGAALYNVFAKWIGGIKVELKADAEIEF